MTGMIKYLVVWAFLFYCGNGFAQENYMHLGLNGGLNLAGVQYSGKGPFSTNLIPRGLFGMEVGIQSTALIYTGINFSQAYFAYDEEVILKEAQAQNINLKEALGYHKMSSFGMKFGVNHQFYRDFQYQLCIGFNFLKVKPTGIEYSSFEKNGSIERPNGQSQSLYNLRTYQYSANTKNFFTPSLHQQLCLSTARTANIFLELSLFQIPGYSVYELNKNAFDIQRKLGSRSGSYIVYQIKLGIRSFIFMEGSKKLKT